MTEPAWWTQAEQRFKAAGLLDEEAEAAYQSTVLKELLSVDARHVDELPEEARDRLLTTELRLWPIAREFYETLHAGVVATGGTTDKKSLRPSARHLCAETPNEMRAFVFSMGRAEDRAEAKAAAE